MVQKKKPTTRSKKSATKVLSKKSVRTRAVGTSVQKKSGQKKSAPGLPVAVVSVSEKICMLNRTFGPTPSLFVSWSTDGVTFLPDATLVVLKNLKGRKEDIAKCENFALSATPSSFLLTYTRVTGKNGDRVLVIARSADMYTWGAKYEMPAGDTIRATLAYSKPLESFEMYRDGLFIKNQSARTLTIWKDKPASLFTSRFGSFDVEKIFTMGSIVTESGIFLVYDASVQHKKHMLLQVGAVLFETANPRHSVWRSPIPLWQGVIELKREEDAPMIVGSAYFKGRFFVYWTTPQGTLITVPLTASFKKVELEQYAIMKRWHKNPVIEPREHHSWENQGTFNPGVFQDDEGVVHMFYRALGSDGISRVGYAQSKNGTYFTKRSPTPIFEANPTIAPRGPKKYHPAFYTSGGGWGGAEDPRVVKIGNRIYMIYVAFEGWGFARLALTSISLKDFKMGHWNWKKPIKISPKNEFFKNWLLFPEKINGKFAIIHSIQPSVLVEYIDDLDDLEHNNIKSIHPEAQKSRLNTWDNRMRGSGPPPLKTDLGWLLLYHATENRDPGKYKIGAMILDKNDPTKVLYRSKHPILSPDMHYENDGKPGVVYASGAVIRGKDLYVYYGGADRVTCVASTNLKQFLEYLKTGSPNKYKLERIPLSTNYVFS